MVSLFVLFGHQILRIHVSELLRRKHSTWNRNYLLRCLYLQNNDFCHYDKDNRFVYISYVLFYLYGIHPSSFCIRLLFWPVVLCRFPATIEIHIWNIRPIHLNWVRGLLLDLCIAYFHCKHICGDISDKILCRGIYISDILLRLF